MNTRGAVYKKVTWRLVPFLFACYILAYVDRVNVGFAKLRMQADLGMSETVYGFEAGLFFIGYFLLEVPANMVLRRLGAALVGAHHDRLGFYIKRDDPRAGHDELLRFAVPVGSGGVRVLSG